MQQRTVRRPGTEGPNPARRLLRARGPCVAAVLAFVSPALRHGPARRRRVELVAVQGGFAGSARCAAGDAAGVRRRGVLALLFGRAVRSGPAFEHGTIPRIAPSSSSLFRAIPLPDPDLLLLLWSPGGRIQMSPFVRGGVGLTLYNGSVLARCSAPEYGPARAARASGLRAGPAQGPGDRDRPVAQALRSMLPTIISQLVVLLKDTALGFPDHLQRTAVTTPKYLGAQPVLHRPLIPVTIVVAAMYIALNLLLSMLATYLERRNRRSRKRLPAPTAVG